MPRPGGAGGAAGGMSVWECETHYLGRGGVPGEVVKPGGGEIVLVGLRQRRDVVLVVRQACVHT